MDLIRTHEILKGHVILSPSSKSISRGLQTTSSCKDQHSAIHIQFHDICSSTRRRRNLFQEYEPVFCSSMNCCDFSVSLVILEFTWYRNEIDCGQTFCEISLLSPSRPITRRKFIDGNRSRSLHRSERRCISTTLLRGARCNKQRRHHASQSNKSLVDCRHAPIA